jgi:tripartite-type tricarboxylate transporter receptor subunit TctC
MKAVVLVASSLAIAGAVCALPGGAAAQYPDKPVRLIVPQAPGSATDVIARLLAAELGAQLGQTVVVDNRPGGALTLGLDLTAKSAPDGYTLCMGPIGALAITRHMVAKLPYDIERDFQPIALVSRGHLLLAVSTALPVHSVKELVEHAKKNPGALTNASSSNGSPGHVGGELFKFMTGTNILHVPYKGGAQAINDLIAGHVHLMFESLNSISSTAKSGKVRGLGVSGPRRSPAFPDTPTIAEAGVPGYDAGTWSGVIAPAGVPKPIVEKLNVAVNRAISTPAFRERFGAIGDEPAGGTPEEFVETIRKDSAKWADVVRRSGAKLD